VKRPGIPDGVQSAMDFICRGMESGRFAVGEYLPAISLLSTMAGVSSVTMSKAQVILKNRGILSGLRGQKTRVANRPPAPEPLENAEASHPQSAVPSSRQETHERIFRQMRRDILDGVYKPGSLLPLAKQLKTRYRAAGITIRKALALLHDEELVAPQRRHYAVARLSTADSGPRIGVLIQQYSLDAYDLGAATPHNHLSEIELQAATIPVSISVAGFDWQAGQWTMKQPCSVLPQDAAVRADMAGYIAAVSSPAEDYHDLCARLALVKKPVSVLDFDGGWMPLSPRNQLYAVFPVGVSSVPGKKVANFLLSLGHHHTAFFSVFHKSRWSRMRYEGVRDAYADAGYPDGPQLFWRSQDDWQVLVEISPQPGLPNLSTTPAVYDLLRNRIQMEAHLHPMFEQAIAMPAITAWVTANDAIAVCALEFLRARGVEAPGRISLVSFDNSVSAMTRRITSYNFNLPGIVGAAFRHVLRSNHRTQAPRPRTVEIPGAIVERETTARARV